MDSYVEQVIVEAHLWQLPFLPFALLLVWLLKRSALARAALVRHQQKFTPQIYADLFEKYKPDIVIGSTPGWREDRYLLREAIARGVDTASIILGWDNPSSYSIPGAPVEHITCWSEIQKEELVLGSDWDPKKINIGGIPIYDGYFEKRWLVPREEYFKLHGLDPDRKLLSYACSFVSFSPNYQNIKALAELVSSNGLSEPCQLLVRLHPNHYWDNWLFEDERKRIYALADTFPHVHVVEPVPIGGELGHYSGEDMHEKSSMMGHADVFLTVYSTMVVEAAIHGSPIISVCIDAPRGWGYVRRLPLRKYSLPLSKIGDWPTHDRFRRAGAGRVMYDKDQLRKALDDYLQDPRLDEDARRAFIAQEVTYMDGSASTRTGEFLASLITGRER
jgi:CDP-glycerol glycerophosphotransferase (TagB/SpsB family)